MSDRLLYKLRSGKPVKSLHFAMGFAGLLVPDAFYRARREQLLDEARRRPDYRYMCDRATY